VTESVNTLKINRLKD